jgi:hypothetical protein
VLAPKSRTHHAPKVGFVRWVIASTWISRLRFRKFNSWSQHHANCSKMFKALYLWSTQIISTKRTWIEEWHIMGPMGNQSASLAGVIAVFCPPTGMRQPSANVHGFVSWWLLNRFLLVWYRLQWIVLALWWSAMLLRVKAVLAKRAAPEQLSLGIRTQSPRVPHRYCGQEHTRTRKYKKWKPAKTGFKDLQSTRMSSSKLHHKI